MSAYQQLRTVPLFSELLDEDLRRLCVAIEEVELAAGAVLFSEGDHGDQAFVVIEGAMEVVKATLGGEVLLAVKTDGVLGEMALLEEAPRNASVRARTNAKLLAIPKAQLDELLNSSPSASRSFFEVMLTRWRNTQSSLQQTERMAQLGTLTAGLAHELNNPAGAVGRSANQLAEAIVRYGDARAAVAVLLTPSQWLVAEGILDGLSDGRAGEPGLSALDRADLEDEIEAWLVHRDVDKSWELASGLAEGGLTIERLERLTSSVGETHLGAVVELVGAAHEQFSLLHQIEEGTRRMSGIVKGLKSYSYLDQAPVQDVDVREGIDDTLMLLAHKIRDVQINKEYADDLPVIEALGGELNQVWTNLIDNALYAMAETDGDDRLVVRACGTDQGVVVEVEDNGPGIPEEIQQRIFDSFYTTKPPGSGTGLGLDISRNIVIYHHGGNLTVTSRPGQTVFRVELPTALPKRP